MTTILVVDDQKSVLNTTKTLLELSGFKVLGANNGKEALEQYREKGSDIDAILLDMGMPMMPGPEVLQRLVEIDPAVKVIIASGDIDESDDKLKKMGAKGLIQKPFKLKELLECIRNVIESA